MLGGRLRTDSIQGTCYRLGHWSGTSSIYYIYGLVSLPTFPFRFTILKCVKSVFVFIQVCFIYQLQKILYTEGSLLIVFQSHWLIFPTRYLTFILSILFQWTPLFIYTFFMILHIGRHKHSLITYAFKKLASLYAEI